MTKVLYIEDNDDNVYMLKMRLELLGDFEVLAAVFRGQQLALILIIRAPKQSAAPSSRSNPAMSPVGT